MIPTTADGRPAFATHLCDRDGVHRAEHLGEEAATVII